MPTFGWNYLNLVRSSFSPLTRRETQITSSTTESPIWDTYIWPERSLVVLLHVDWWQKMGIWNRKMVKTTIPALNRKKPKKYLELEIPINKVLLHGFQAFDPLKMAICKLYIEWSLKKIQISKNCNTQEKTFTLWVRLDALDVTAATLHPVSELLRWDLWPYRHEGEES